jgi:protein-S-isoprenylcysteine O-methyltransferase Ste14
MKLGEDDDAPEAADVAVRPPVLFAGGLVAACILELVAPLGPGLAGGTLLPVGFGIGIAAIGAALAWLAAKRFAAAGTAVSIAGPTETLVIEGPFRFTRNPVYIGLIVLYFGLALALTSGWGMLLLPALVFVLHRGVVLREEAFLAAKFGARYEAYREKVPRWL